MTQQRETRSVRFFPSRSGSAPTERAFLFTRDVPLGIMPIRGSDSRGEYRAELEPASQEVSEWLRGFLHIGQFEGPTLDQALVEFVESASQHLAYAGCMFNELVSGDEPGDLPKRLSPLPPGRIRYLPGRYLQVVPREDREALDGHRWFVVPSEDMWHLSLPRALGTPRMHRRMLKTLERLSLLVPPFAMQAGDLGRAHSYDFSVHRKATELALERATNRWGTIPSLFQVEGTTEYFLFARRLQWQRSQALLREHLFDQLNRLLSRLAIPHRLVVSGLPTSSDIAATIEKLHAGEVDVADAMASSRL
jgi:hypothetical protein